MSKKPSIVVLKEKNIDILCKKLGITKEEYIQYRKNLIKFSKNI